ncbi:hypothetical protein VTJ83DRAFT_1447 [Remersonia thermophila]|uniref:Alpha/beta hydrolase fold-3 domain-containing protein n=1 Tax=Remersonia thermophila TaxID=72144 RepID=A0ABR4DQ72_9PEZI
MTRNNAVNMATGQLSLWNRCTLAILTPVVAVRWIFGFLSHRNATLHWRQRLALTLLQALRTSLPPDLKLSLARRSSTGEEVAQYCNKNSIPREVVVLNVNPVGSDVPALTLHILTPPESSGNDSGPTILYIHGGGYVNPLRGPAHMPFIMECAAACRARKVVVLAYALAPEHPYPAQLIHSVEALRHLLQPTTSGMNLRPEDVILAGDSAGGQLVGAVLAHIVHPSPYAAPLRVDGQLRAALLVSPFVRLPPPGSGSYESNHGLDYLTRPQVDVFKAAWCAREDEIWANLCGVEGSRRVWSRVFTGGPSRLVQKVMVTVGTAEIFLDCCRTFAREYVEAQTIAANKDTDFSVFQGMDAVLAECEGEVHVQPALDAAGGYNEGIMKRAIMSWLGAV